MVQLHYFLSARGINQKEQNHCGGTERSQQRDAPHPTQSISLPRRRHPALPPRPSREHHHGMNSKRETDDQPGPDLSHAQSRWPLPCARSPRRVSASPRSTSTGLGTDKSSPPRRLSHSLSASRPTRSGSDIQLSNLTGGLSRHHAHHTNLLTPAPCGRPSSSAAPATRVTEQTAPVLHNARLLRGWLGANRAARPRIHLPPGPGAVPHASLGPR